MITVLLGPISPTERRALQRWASAEKPGKSGIYTASLRKVYAGREWGRDAIDVQSRGVAALSEADVAGVAMHDVEYVLGRVPPHKIACEHIIRPNAPTDPSRDLTWAEEYIRGLRVPTVGPSKALARSLDKLSKGLDTAG